MIVNVSRIFRVLKIIKNTTAKIYDLKLIKMTEICHFFVKGILRLKKGYYESLKINLLTFNIKF